MTDSVNSPTTAVAGPIGTELSRPPERWMRSATAPRYCSEVSTRELLAANEPLWSHAGPSRRAQPAVFTHASWLTVRAMRRLVLLAPAVALLAGCGPAIVSGTATPSPPSASTGTAAGAQLPPDPQPAATGDCPYLDSQFVADSNGQH